MARVRRVAGVIVATFSAFYMIARALDRDRSLPSLRFVCLRRRLRRK
jgi:hypothetical protein